MTAHRHQCHASPYQRFIAAYIAAPPRLLRVSMLGDELATRGIASQCLSAAWDDVSSMLQSQPRIPLWSFVDGIVCHCDIH